MISSTGRSGTFTGRFDDNTATGTVGLFGAATDLGAERCLRLNFNSADSGTVSGKGTNIKFDVIVESYKRMPSRGAITQFELVLQPTGPLTYVTTT